MKVSVALLTLAVISYAETIRRPIPSSTAYGYLRHFGIPRGEQLRKAEEQYSISNNTRIVGGAPAVLGQYPYQAGLLLSMVGIDGIGVCGGAVVSANRIVTAAHCWFDGLDQVWMITVVLGSVTLFTGGTRIETSSTAVHPNWYPHLARNDVAVIYLPTPVTFSNIIAPVNLPSGTELNEEFVGFFAVASGFGRTGDDAAITTGQFLSHVRLNIIHNFVCSLTFPATIQTSNICTSGAGGIGTCRGDSGGPLVLTRAGREILIGINSFTSAAGCESGAPSAYARVTSFVGFINQHII